jgi:hypothetical protein
MYIKCHDIAEILLKVVFNTNQSINIYPICLFHFQASSWSSKRHEIYGHIHNPEGKIVHYLSGKWNEALYCGQHATSRLVWRPGMTCNLKV